MTFGSAPFTDLNHLTCLHFPLQFHFDPFFSVFGTEVVRLSREMLVKILLVIVHRYASVRTSWPSLRVFLVSAPKGTCSNGEMGAQMNFGSFKFARVVAMAAFCHGAADLDLSVRISSTDVGNEYLVVWLHGFGFHLRVEMVVNVY